MIAIVSVQPAAIHEVQTILLLLLGFVILFALLARWLKTPYPIVLVIAGLLLGFVPVIPDVVLDPDIIFLVVLPPLLYSAAWNTPWREFRANLVNVSMLAFGLVGFTVLGVSLLAPRVLTGFDWRLGFVLGAVVATTDAIAATSIGKRIGLPHSVIDVLEGESLLNDATGLLALEFGISIVVYGQTPTVGAGLLRLLWLTVGGLGVGVVIGYLVDRFERRVEYGAIEIVLSLLIPYATYTAAEAVQASGVLAVVACGLYLSRGSAEFFSPKVRLQATAVWSALSFALNGLTFILIGLQLPVIVHAIQGKSISRLILDGAILSALLILLRLLWVFPGAYIANRVRRHLLHEDVRILPPRQTFVIGWTGMRGVIALAAALSLPTSLNGGAAFPQRNTIVFLTFCVILVTLVLQGLSLPSIIRFLGLAEAGGSDAEENYARRTVLEAALGYLYAAREKDSAQRRRAYDHLAIHYEKKLDELRNRNEDNSDGSPSELGLEREIAQKLLKVERETAVGLRNRGAINDEVLRRLELELDLTEARTELPRP